MKIGFLTIGTEILLGDTVNTNLTNLGKRLYENGFKLDKDITISDQQDEINNALNFLLKIVMLLSLQEVLVQQKMI